MKYPTQSRFFRKQAILVAVALISALVALVLPFLVLTPNQSAWAVRKTSYWGMAGLLLLFVWFVRSEIKLRSPFRRLVSREWAVIGVALLCSIWTSVHSDFEYRILFDEYVIGGAALSYHCSSESGHGVMMPSSNGVVSPSWFVVDKRPNFFPFILSLVHGLVGYSPHNVFGLNVLLTFCLFLLLHYFVARIAGHRWGLFSQLAWAGLPLVGMSTTSGGYEIMNLGWILVLGLSGLHYLRTDGSRGLNLMIASSVILANCRYESILYTLIPVGLVAIKVGRERRLSLTPFAALSPLFLLFPLMSNRIFYSNEAFFQTDKGSFFGWDFFVSNLKAAGEFLFHNAGYLPNSLFVSVLGFVSFVILLPGLFRVWRSEQDGMVRNAACILVILTILVCSNTIMSLFIFWGAWPDLTTSRFSLPLHLLMVVTIPISWRMVLGPKTIPLWVCSLPVIYIGAWGACVSGRQMLRPTLPASYGYNWMLNEPPSFWDKDQTLVISEGTLGAVLFGYYSFSIPKNDEWFRDRLHEFQESRILPDIVFAEYHAESPFRGGTGKDFGHVLPDFLILDTQDSKRFTFDLEFRLSRLLGLKMPVPKAMTESEMTASQPIIPDEI